MSIWLRIADRMIFQPSRHPIDPEGRRRVEIESSSGSFEAWVLSTKSQAPDWFGLKFPGAGGRAERGGTHPFDVVCPDANEVWTINPPGYGRSAGRVSLTTMTLTADQSWARFVARAGGRKKLLIGNSLGCLYALYIAARVEVQALFLRNPPPLREVILGRYSWWNMGLGARLVSRQVPEQMDGIENAKACGAPALFVMSQRDRMIPPQYQQKIIDAYAGTKSVFVVENADHHHPVPDDQLSAYCDSLRTFFRAIE